METQKMSNEELVRERFSQIYAADTKNNSDSRRFRVRFSSFISNKLTSYSLVHKINVILGLDVYCFKNALGGYTWDIKGFILQSEIKDILDLITIVFNLFSDQKSITVDYKNKYNLQEAFVKFINQCFLEESLCYKCDEKGIIHFNPDEQFYIDKQVTLHSLTDLRYRAVLDEFSKSYEALDSGNNHTRVAILHIFTSIEILFLNICGGSRIKKLCANEVKKGLIPVIDDIYKNHSKPTKDVIKQKIDEFSKWVTSAHIYRHGQASDEIDNPPIEIAILIISTGVSFLRWLIEIDQLHKGA